MSKNKKQKQLFKDNKEIDTLLIRNYSGEQEDPTINMFAETNFSSTFDGFMLITKDDITAISSPLSLEYSKGLSNNKSINFMPYKSYKDLKDKLNQYSGKKIGINMDITPFNTVKEFKKILNKKTIVESEKHIRELRENKTDWEITQIKKAASITKKSIEQVVNSLKIGLSEQEIATLIEVAMKELNGEPAFKTIVAMGKNSNKPHYFPTTQRIGKNAIILIDAGTKYNGYCSDVSRTISFGKATKDQHEKYAEVREALETTLKAIKKGEIAGNIYKVAQDKLSLPLPHALGHGIGITEHDFPEGIGPTSSWTIEKNYCLAIEPAIYKKNWGIRLEDDIAVVKATGIERFSRAPKELLEL